MGESLILARKEFHNFFASPAAFLFLGAFLLVTLFVFFWVETFFARNIADVRPLFEWMPLLMIFLVAALTMRSWSEERRSGALESLLTSPVPPYRLVLGKFLAALSLVALALLLTLPLPLSVSLLGPLDWGPVLGGYLAGLFVAAAYIAIGLYMSVRTDNPIVALILTLVACGAFYLLGAPTVTSLFGHQVGNLLTLLGSGSRFDAINRGVIDLRDLYYYLSLVGVFLLLNLHALERLRWAGNPTSARHRRWHWLIGLAVVNLLAGNLWLQSIGWARADITAGRQYSLSEATRGYLQQLREPLLIRGYFSSNTHPLLAPLVPRIKDLLAEYAVAAGDRARIEFVDPHQDQALEEEAASKYGIRPIPFQMASKYQAAVVNSYFDILVAYGDQYQVLGYDDLIEVKLRGEGDLDVLLKNPEYSITQAIRKLIGSYQAGGNPFETLDQAVSFHGFFSSPERLPDYLARFAEDVRKVLDEMQQASAGRLTGSFQDPEADGGDLARSLTEEFGYGPQIASLLDPSPFWFYMQLRSADQRVQIPLPEQLDAESFRRALTAALQSLAPGFMRTLALVRPAAPQPGMGRGMMATGERYSRLQQLLAENVRIKETDLQTGLVPAGSDLLLLLSPEHFDDKQLFAVDQFLMQGGTVVVATSPFAISTEQGLNAVKQQSGLEQWLAHHGIRIGESMVLDSQNAALPVPVDRQLGPITVQEIRMLPYPHFPDVRGEGLNGQHPVTAHLQQLTLNWVSPIELDDEIPPERQVTKLLYSSPTSWTSEALQLIPDYQAFPRDGFPAGQEQARQLLAVAQEGRFDSYFAERQSPLLQQPETEDPQPAEGESREAEVPDPKQTIGSVIRHSSDSARLVVIGSNSFASDAMLELASEGMGTIYTKPIELLQNIVDWALDDGALLAIRGRTQFARTLLPLQREEQLFWEYANYALALFGLFLVWLWRRSLKIKAEARYRAILAEV